MPNGVLIWIKGAARVAIGPRPGLCFASFNGGSLVFLALMRAVCGGLIAAIEVSESLLCMSGHDKLGLLFSHPVSEPANWKG